MEQRPPLTRLSRLGVHLFAVACFLVTIPYFVRQTQERHIALGMHGTSDQHFVFVRPGSVAYDAGIREGDRLDNPTRAWLDGLFADEPTYSFPVARGNDTLQITLPIQHRASVGERLASVPPDMISTWLVGVFALLLGWWVFVRAPDAETVVPFVLWSAVTAPFWAVQSWSAYWSTDMWTINTLLAIPVESGYQALALHWLLVFPSRLVKRKWIVGLYGLFAVLTVGLIVLAFATADKPTDEMSLKGLLVAGTAIVLCLVQFRRAPSIKARRQSGWVLLPILTFSLISFFAWDAPHLADISLPIRETTITSLVAYCYLVIPLGIAIAITREGLFRIDRIVTKGMALGGSLLLMFLAYIGFVVLLAQFLNLDDHSSMPVFWGFIVACSLAVLFRPLQRNLEKTLDRVLLRRQQRFDEAVALFDAGLIHAVDRPSLERLLCKAVTTGVDVLGCSVSDAELSLAEVAPGQVAADSYHSHLTVSEDLPANTALRYPVSIGQHYFGCLELGPKASDRYSDDDLLFLERLALRAADHSARLALQAQALRRELDFAKTRLRIASDLHDDIGSNLSGLALLTDADGGDTSEQQARLRQIGRFARSMVDSLRDIVWSIDPESDSTGHLIDRMRDSASTILRGMDHTFDVAGTLKGQVTPDFQRNVFLIFKEAIHNAARHSGANRVRISMLVDGADLVLEVSDDGSGFDPDGTAKNGLGRRTMAHRAKQIGGDLTLRSEPGGGTTVLLRVKMARTRHSESDGTA